MGCGCEHTRKHTHTHTHTHNTHKQTHAGARLVSARLLDEPLRSWLPSRRVLVLGAGTGLEALVAQHIGAKVVATDSNPLPLALLEYASTRQHVNADGSGSGSGWGSELGSLRSMPLNILSDEKLPRCDLLIGADCIYNAGLARALADRCLEAWARGADVMVADSQGFHRADFYDRLVEGWEAAKLQAHERHMMLQSLLEEEEAAGNVDILHRTLPPLEDVHMEKVLLSVL